MKCAMQGLGVKSLSGNMKKTKMFTVEGVPGAGKSTISQFLTNQLVLNEIQAVWLDEYQLGTGLFAEFHDAHQ